MYLRTQTLAQKHFIGKRLSMSFAQNKTFELWRSFMPYRNQIQNVVGDELYSIELYPAGFYNEFNPTREFEKWAAVEVTDTDHFPEGMESLTSPAGLYAVFLHKGPVSDGPKTYQYIFADWLPKSGYKLDNRPHFAVMDERYQPNSADSEEEIWIPVV